MSALIVSGAIASSGGYAFAEIQTILIPSCIPSRTNPCLNGSGLGIVRTDGGHTHAVMADHTHAAIKDHIRKIFKSKQAIQILEIYDPYTVDKLIQGDATTLQNLEQLSPSTKLQVQLYLQQLDQPVIDQ